MEGLKAAFRAYSLDPKLELPSSSCPSSSSFSRGGAVAPLSIEQSGVVITRPPRQAVSVPTCSKLCAIFFVAGIVVGFTLKRRVRRWASKLLKRIRDD